jgi:hypothetical protein
MIGLPQYALSKAQTVRSWLQVEQRISPLFQLALLSVQVGLRGRHLCGLPLLPNSWQGIS